MKKDYELTQDESTFTLDPGEKMTAQMLAELLLRGHEDHGDLLSISGEGRTWKIRWDRMAYYDRKRDESLPDEGPPELADYD